MRRIGILTAGFMSWAGGIDFLRMVVDALRVSAPPDSDFVLLVPRMRLRSRVRFLVAPCWHWLRRRHGHRGLKQLRESYQEQTTLSPRWQYERLREALGHDVPAVFYFGEEELRVVVRRHGLTCLLPAIWPLSESVAVPWIGYMFDFQHRHLPELFTEIERLTRDRSFDAMARTARYVVVNSQQVRADCLRFLQGRAEFVALPFGAAPRAEWLADDPGLLAKYNLPDRYFLVANQFWTHKNHRLVFEALRLLAEEATFRGVQVACTGSTTDVRDRKHFPSLLQLIHEAKLGERVRILGSIPKRDQVEVMKNAIAVVQPTLFEGGPGGGAVYDAVSLGVPALVSDIPVNRELERYEALVRFFDPKDAQGLARLMLEMAKEPLRARPDPRMLMDEGLRRRQAVGEVLWQTIESEIAAYSSVSGK